MDSNLVVFLDMGSGVVWVMYDFAAGDTLLQVSADYGATWGGAITIADFYGLDLFKIGTDAFCFGYDVVGGTYEVWKWVDPNWVVQDTLVATGTTTKNSLGLVVGTNYYCISYDEVGGDTGGYLFKYANATTTISNEILIADGWYIQQTHQDTLFKATTAIWYVRLRNAGGDYRIYKTIDSGANWTIAFTEQHWYFYPSNYQRVGDDFYFFGRYGASWYQIDYYKYNSQQDFFYKIQRDTAPTASDVFTTMVPIPIVFYTESAASDYMNIGEQTNKINDLATAKGNYKTHGFPKGRFEYTTSLSTDQHFEIFENNSGSRTLVFLGRVGTPKYTIRKGKPFYQFRPKNFGWNDLNEKISYTATAEGIDEVVIALLGLIPDPYLYGDATSIPDTGLTMTYKFDNVRFKDALYVCCILANGYWFFDPNGYFHFYKWSTMPNSGDTFSQATNTLGIQKAIIVQNQYNSYNNVVGGWDSANNTEFTPTTPTVAAHIQQYGKLEWDGRKSFAGADTQASLDAIITGLKAWQGIDENPVDAEGFVIGKYYYPVGYYASHQYSGRTEFATPTDRIIIKNVTDFKRPGKIELTFSNNLVRKS